MKKLFKEFKIPNRSLTRDMFVLRARIGQGVG